MILRAKLIQLLLARKIYDILAVTIKYFLEENMRTIRVINVEEISSRI